MLCCKMAKLQGEMSQDTMAMSLEDVAGKSSEDCKGGIATSENEILLRGGTAEDFQKELLQWEGLQHQKMRCHRGWALQKTFKKDTL